MEHYRTMLLIQWLIVWLLGLLIEYHMLVIFLTNAIGAYIYKHFSLGNIQQVQQYRLPVYQKSSILTSGQAWLLDITDGALSSLSWQLRVKIETAAHTNNFAARFYTLILAYFPFSRSFDEISASYGPLSAGKVEARTSRQRSRLGKLDLTSGLFSRLP